MKNISRFITLFVIATAAFIAARAELPWRWSNYNAGVANHAVFCIFGDSQGSIWLGTNSGIYYFEGYDFYPCRAGESVFSGQVYAITEKDGTIYAGTNVGLYRLDRSEMELREVSPGSPREIRSLAWSNGILAVGSLNGLYLYDPARDSISGPVRGLTHNAVYSLLAEDDGTLYIGTYNGLWRRSPQGNLRNIAIPCSGFAGGNAFINSICRDSGGGLYLGMEGALMHYNPQTENVQTVGDIGNVCVKALTMLGNNLVAGTDNGLLIITPQGTVSTQRHNSRDPFSLSSNVVWSLYAEGNRILWAGTGLGLSIVDIDSPVRVLRLADLTGSPEGQQVYQIFRDSGGTLWLGGTNGLIAFADGKSPRWYLPGNGDNTLSHNRVRDITQTSDGTLWVATDGGINIYNPLTGRFTNHRIIDSARNLNANWAYTILEDPVDSTVWTAGYLGGIFVEQLDKFRSEGSHHNPDRVYSVHNGLPNNLIGQLVADRHSNKWIMHYRNPSLTRIDSATDSITQVSLASVTGSEPAMVCAGPGGDLWCAVYGGLVRISPEGNVDSRMVRFPYSDGCNVTAMCPVGDELWVATDVAVFSVDPQSMEARILPLPELTYTAIYPDSVSDRIIFGSVDEIVAVDAARLSAEGEPLRAAVRQMESQGNLISLDNQLYSPAEVRLPNQHRQVNISLQMSSFAPGHYRRFCYSLDGEPWRLLNVGHNKLSFNELRSGSHTLAVAVAGFEDYATTLNLTVAPPWYATTLALVIYVVLFILLAGAAGWVVRSRHKARLEAAQRRSVLEAVDRRISFLGNISHELKTPLSMIIGPLSRLETAEIPEQARADIDTAYKNALRLNTLVHQTLELNSLDNDADKMLIYSNINVVEFCKDVVESYRNSTPERKFLFSADLDTLDVRVDVVKLESLLNNLITNAIKYSPAGSTVACSVRDAGSDFEIVVADEGVGIPAAEQALVFQRLYRSPRTADTARGTGIGLYLVKRYASLMGGSVSLSSLPGQGTTFTLRLPVTPDDNDDADQRHTSAGMESDTAKHHKILIVDDNKPIAAFISSLLEKEYNCQCAFNGREALTVASTFVPDLVIADEMMPVMSGLEMSRRMRANPALASVPILMLTAKDTAATHAASLEAGVEAFMAKPFEAKVLLAKVHLMLEAADQMRQRLRYQDITGPSEATNTESTDERRLAAVAAVIEANIANPDLNVAFVCQQTAMSTKTLYRLVKKYTGVSPLDFIRQSRLRQAAALLRQGKFSVSEVMYMVGFSSSSYFSKSFAQQFGCTPGQYKDSSQQ